MFSRLNKRDTIWSLKLWYNSYSYWTCYDKIWNSWFNFFNGYKNILTFCFFPNNFFSRDVSILPKFSNLLALSINNTLLLNFNLCCLCSYIPLSFLAFLVCFPLFFFLINFPIGLAVLLIFFQEQPFWFVDSLYYILFSIASITLTSY